MLKFILTPIFRKFFGIIKDCKDCAWCDGEKCKKFVRITNFDEVFAGRANFIFDHHPCTKMREQDCGKWAEYFRKNNLH